jgi:hypothetical protein
MPRARHVAIAAIAFIAIGLAVLGLLRGKPKRGHTEHDLIRGVAPVSGAASAAAHRDGRSATALDAISTSVTAYTLNLSALRVTYENCVAGLPANRRKRLHKIHWLHFPKCGTSLGTVVHGYLCQSEPSPSHYRQPGRQRDSVCDYCELEQMNKQGTPFWDGKIRAMLPLKPEIRKYCDWNVSVDQKRALILSTVINSTVLDQLQLLIATLQCAQSHTARHCSALCVAQIELLRLCLDSD